MHRLLSHPVARFVSVTALIGSLADWTLFAALVSLVDARTEGSAWATAAVLFARVLPSTVFAPIAARRIDGADLGRTLAVHESGRVLAVLALAILAPRTSLLVPVALLVALEFAAAILAAGRESLISRHVPSELHTSVNTATAVASYGLLPVGALVVQFVGSEVAMLVSLVAYGALLASYLVAWPIARETKVVAIAKAQPNAPVVAGLDASLLRTIAAAGLGLAPIVALFTVAPRLSERWLGDATATGLPMGLLLVGGALGFLLVNRGARDWQGLVAASAGFVLTTTMLWHVGVLMVGVGAGIAYLALQTRLQAEATDPSQFARAFSLLKVATIAGTVAGPLLWSVGDGTVLLFVAAATSLVSTALVIDPRPFVRRGVRRLLLAVVRVRVVGERVPGPMVVVSNHPNALDGVVALAADLELRPIARWQRNLVARAGFWLAEAVVTTAGTDRAHRPAWDQAAEHLRDGGRIWLAPEGGAHTNMDLRAPRSGAVRMAAAASVPIQALGIRHHGGHGGPTLRSWRPWRRPSVTLVWGDAVHTTGVVADDNDRMMRAVAAASGMRWDPTATRLARETPRTVAA